MPVIGPYTSHQTLSKLDGRRREARLAKSLRADLVAHLGGAPSVTQRALIERAVALSLHVALMERRMSEAADPVMGQRDSNHYLAWSNALERTLRRLGLQSAPPPTAGRTLEHYAASRSAARVPV